jgi:hypothetical protein
LDGPVNPIQQVAQGLLGGVPTATPFTHFFSEIGSLASGVPVATVEQQKQHAMEEWIRLLHQVLLFVHCRAQQSQPQEPPSSTIAFRSLLLEYQDGYTSACARLLTHPNTLPEIQSMIRLQLEELSMKRRRTGRNETATTATATTIFVSIT